MEKQKAETERDRQADLNQIEADIAYFEARLLFARRGKDTLYKQALRRACQSLRDSLKATLKKQQGQ